MKRLTTCSICNRPLILFEMFGDGDTVRARFSSKESQGPTTHPQVREWCTGLCNSVKIQLWLLADSLRAHVKRSHRRTTLASSSRYMNRALKAYDEIAISAGDKGYVDTVIDNARKALQKLLEGSTANKNQQKRIQEVVDNELAKVTDGLVKLLGGEGIKRVKK